MTKILDREEHSERLSNGSNLTSHSTLGTKSVRSAVSRALNKSIWLPLCVHEPKVRWHSCTSKGKKATSTEQELLVMDGWSHMTWPSLRITTLVSMVLVNSSSALEIIENVEASLKFPVHIHLSFFCVLFFFFFICGSDTPTCYTGQCQGATRSCWVCGWCPDHHSPPSSR